MDYDELECYDEYYEDEYVINEEVKKMKCEVCLEEVIQETNYESYTTHLAQHDLEDIKKKVKVKEALACFGITDDVEMKNAINSVENEYNMIQCKLCENMIYNYIDLKKKHLKEFHRSESFSDFFIFYDFPINFTTKEELYLCDKCGVYMGNLETLINFHNYITHLNSRYLINNEHYMYCSVCHTSTNDMDHIHHSYFCLESNSPLVTFYKENKSKLNQSHISIESNSKIEEENTISENPTKKKTEICGPSDEYKKISLYELKRIYEKLSSTERKTESFVEELFIREMKSHKFAYTNEIYSKKKHYFYNEIIKSKPTANLLKRLDNEFKKIDKELPCEFSHSFFVRADEKHPQLIKAIIVGARGTPYEHGLFEFDIFVPNDYPNTYPKCNLMTTGSGIIRFNPNLYNTGHVCLSLLGTWRGNSTENWNPTQSNLTQLLLSIQSIVMSNDIIINEPGLENLLKTHLGVFENEAYSNIVRIGNIIYAMIDQLKNPPIGFEVMVKDYFRIKGYEILKDIESWITRFYNTCVSYSGITRQQNPKLCSQFGLVENAYPNEIKKQKDILRNLIDKLVNNEIDQ